MRIHGPLVVLGMGIVVALLIGLPGVVGSSTVPEAGVIEVDSAPAPDRGERSYADRGGPRRDHVGAGRQRGDREGAPGGGDGASTAPVPGSPRRARPPVPAGGGDDAYDDDAYDDDGYDETYDDGAFDDDEEADPEESDRSGDEGDDPDEPRN